MARRRNGGADWAEYRMWEWHPGDDYVSYTIVEVTDDHYILTYRFDMGDPDYDEEVTKSFKSLAKAMEHAENAG